MKIIHKLWLCPPSAAIAAAVAATPAVAQLGERPDANEAVGRVVHAVAPKLLLST